MEQLYEREEVPRKNHFGYLGSIVHKGDIMMLEIIY